MPDNIGYGLFGFKYWYRFHKKDIGRSLVHIVVSDFDYVRFAFCV